MSTEREQLESTIAGLEAQRALLGDAVLELALAPLRAKLATLATTSSSEPPAQTLRQVSILFLDIVGSTTLGERLDPEATSAVMDGALGAYTTIVGQHGGKVLQYAGDNVLAAFGADETREDDPERAVRAGLALRDEGRTQADLVKQQHGHDNFNVRIGVHTGGVLLGAAVDAGGSIRGQAVNIAARMEQTAPPGGLRISHDTYRHVRGVFEVEPQPPLAVKGVEEPIATYLVLGVKPRAFRVASRGIEGIETRMIGRDAELEQLQAAFLALHAGGKLAAVTIVAEAGMGKSRLLYEFRNWAEARPERFMVFQGRATPQTPSQPYGLLRDIVAWRLQIADTDSMEAAKARLEAAIAPLFMADDGAELAQAHAHLLGHLVGMDYALSPHVRGIIDDPRQIRNRGFHAAAQVFRRSAAAAAIPLILCIDDLHWADDASLDFLNYLAHVNRDVPMLVVGLTRPALFERRTDWNSTEGIHQRIDLGPLDKRASRDLALELLKKLPDIPAALRELITGGADGNPFYMEELVKMLVDQGAIETGAERWTLHAEKLLATKVPATLTGVLQARLDGLPAREKLALQQASVVGLVFWDAALAALDAQAPDALPALVRRELTLPRKDATLEGMREYAFRHQILHQVTYDTLLKRSRRELHARAAAWLAGLTGARASDFLGATAEHYERAGDNINACEYLARAAEHARERFDHTALDYVARALALLGDDASPGQHELRWRLLEVRERTLNLQGKRVEQRVALDALDQLAEAQDDDRRRAEVAWRRGDVAYQTADYRMLEHDARQGMALAARAGDDALRLRAQQQLGTALGRHGDFSGGKALARDGLAAARALALRWHESLFLSTLGTIAFMQGDLVTRLEVMQQRLQITRDIGDRLAEAVTLANLSQAWICLGNAGEARRWADDALQVARAIGARACECNPLLTLAELALREGEDTLALAHAQASLDIAVEVQAMSWELISLWQLGNAELALGRYAAARAAFARCRDEARAIEHANLHNAMAGLARVALAQNDVTGAVREVETLLAHLDSGGTLDGTEQPRLIELICHQVLTRASDPRAAAVLQAAHAALQATVATIPDAAMRQSFLSDIPEHREIVAAWAASRSTGAG